MTEALAERVIVVVLRRQPCFQVDLYGVSHQRHAGEHEAEIVGVPLPNGTFHNSVSACDVSTACYEIALSRCDLAL